MISVVSPLSRPPQRAPVVCGLDPRANRLDGLHRRPGVSGHMLPISVLVPTRNSMALLPKHAENMRTWLDLVQEVVAVDSHSADGTLEFLQRELRHPDVRVFTHPPGLYQSWNFGIAQCRAKYVYISTVGETITRPGLEKLCAAAESFRAEVVISPPRMVKMSGEPKEKIWPVHTLVQALRRTNPFLLEPAAGELFAVANLLRGILGSSASNLYRADILQRFPFRTDFGTAGDLAWGLEHAGEVRLAVVPESFSTFVFHPKSYAKSDYEVSDFNEKCFTLASSAAETRRAGGQSSEHARQTLAELFAGWSRLLDGKRRVVEVKSSAMWWLSAGAWAQVRERKAAERDLARLQDNAMLELAQHVAHASSPE